MSDVLRCSQCDEDVSGGEGVFCKHCWEHRRITIILLSEGLWAMIRKYPKKSVVKDICMTALGDSGMWNKLRYETERTEGIREAKEKRERYLLQNPKKKAAVRKREQEAKAAGESEVNEGED